MEDITKMSGSKHFVGNGLPLHKRGLTVQVRGDNIKGALSLLKRLIEDERMDKDIRRQKHYTPKGLKRRQQESEGKMRCRKKHMDRLEELGVSGFGKKQA